MIELFRKNVDTYSDYSSTTDESEFTDIWESSEADSSDSDYSYREGDSPAYNDSDSVFDDTGSYNSISSESQPADDEQSSRKLCPRKEHADSVILNPPHQKQCHSSDSCHEGDSPTEYSGSLSAEIGNSDSSSQPELSMQLRSQKRPATELMMADQPHQKERRIADKEPQ